MKETTYYGCATIPGTRKHGILKVTRRYHGDASRAVPTEPVSQEWTGEEFGSWKAAVARVAALNAELFPA